MSTLRTLKQRLSSISRLRDERDYNKALSEVETLLETWPGNSYLHVLKASLVQLQEEPKYDLDEAKRALQQAIELDKASPVATIELGHFLDNVEDDPRAALKAYGEGVAAARHLLIDGLIGQAKAYRQMDRNEDFLRCLLEILHLTHAGSGSKRSNEEGVGADIIVQFSTGQIQVFKLKGTHGEQIQELLSELGGAHPAEPVG